jgi:predicted phage tail protein
MQVIIKVATTPLPLPAGVTAGSLRFQLLDASNNVAATQEATDTSVTFDNVADGAYTATVQRLDSAGNPLGGAVSHAFTVATPPASATTYDAPASLIISIQ